MTPESAVGFLWLIWLVSWFVASVWSEKTVTRPGLGREALYRIVTTAGAALLFFRSRLGDFGTLLLWSANTLVGWAMVGLALLGVLFAWWARIHLGRLWSSTVTRKEDHHIVETGPYALVRHPIYTGLILAILATAATFATASAVMGAVLMVIGCYIKARLEEQFLREQLGPQQFDVYARRAPMLVPFSRRTR